MLSIALAFTDLGSANALSQSAGHDVDELAKKTQNPVGDVTSFPFQHNFNFRTGPFERDQYLLNIQPVKPVQLDADWNLIVRPIIPILSQPVGRFDRDLGVGDIELQTFLTPRNAGSFVWGIGPIAQFPSRSEVSLGNGMWGAGVGAVFVNTSGPWVIGALVNHVWSIGEASLTQKEFSRTTLQPFINYNFGSGWAMSVQSTSTADWTVQGEKWTVPIGASVTKTFVLAHQPMSLGAGAFYNVVRPDDAADWQIKVTYSLIFPGH